MSEVNERLVRVEQSQLHQEKQSYQTESFYLNFNLICVIIVYYIKQFITEEE